VTAGRSPGATGAEEEARALRHFEKMGWKLLRRNYRTKVGEIDLVLEEPKGAVVFMEVKYRSGSDYGGAAASVGPGQRRRIGRAAACFIKEKNLQGRDFRFDVASLTPEGVEHIPAAFTVAGFTL